MLRDQEIVLENRTYRWEYDADQPAQLSWRWVDCARPDFEPPGGIRERLQGEFIRTTAPGLVQKLAGNENENEIERLAEILRSMGANTPQINRIVGRGNVDHDDEAELDQDHATQDSSDRSPFNDRVLRDWFFAKHVIPDWVPTLVSLHGQGPFGVAEFQEFLSRSGIRVGSFESAVTVLIIGRTDWSERKINGLIDDNNDNPLRIYSQEMFLSHLATGDDPFLAPRQVPMRFKKGHPGLEFVSQGWHGWVEPWARGTIPNNAILRADQSPLKVLGYVVGENGLPDNERHALLTRAFHENLPFVNHSEYMAKWGKNGECSRLRRIAQHLEGMCRTVSPTGNRRRAFLHWFMDLEWLKQKFYHGVCDFEWPDDCVRMPTEG